MALKVADVWVSNGLHFFRHWVPQKTKKVGLVDFAVDVHIVKWKGKLFKS